MGKTSRDKGKRGEREVAEILRQHGYCNSRRGVQYNGADGSADVVGIDGVHIEVKRTETLRLYESLAQSREDARDDEIPTVIHRRNGKPWVVIMDLEDWLKMKGN